MDLQRWDLYKEANVNAVEEAKENEGEILYQESRSSILTHPQYTSF